MTFDGPNKLIVLSAAMLDLQTLWAAWKAWLRAGNAQYALALNTVGGEPIDPSAGTLVPLYLFLLNGWKLRPMEADHTLSVVGGTLLVEGGGDPFVSTLGDFTVRIRYQQPVQAIGYSTTGSTGPSASDIAAALLAALNATTIPTDVRKVNGDTIIGHGIPPTYDNTGTMTTPGDPWRPA